jgi:hypothetical protein
MNKWCFLALFLFGIAQTKSSSLDLQQQFIVALKESESFITDCSKVAVSAARGASTLASQFKNQIWGSTTFKWQFCAKTNLQFNRWKPGVEALLKKTFFKKIQIKNYAKHSWIQWDFCFGCYAQAFQVLAEDGKHEVWIEYYKYEFFEGAITVYTKQPGGFIRVGALY